MIPINILPRISACWRATRPARPASIRRSSASRFHSKTRQWSANLRRPVHATRPPVAILLPGLDACKEELHAWSDAFVRRGLGDARARWAGAGRDGVQASDHRPMGQRDRRRDRRAGAARGRRWPQGRGRGSEPRRALCAARGGVRAAHQSLRVELRAVRFRSRAADNAGRIAGDIPGAQPRQDIGEAHEIARGLTLEGVAQSDQMPAAGRVRRRRQADPALRRASAWRTPPPVRPSSSCSRRATMYASTSATSSAR